MFCDAQLPLPGDLSSVRVGIGCPSTGRIFLGLIPAHENAAQYPMRAQSPEIAGARNGMLRYRRRLLVCPACEIAKQKFVDFLRFKAGKTQRSTAGQTSTSLFSLPRAWRLHAMEHIQQRHIQKFIGPQ
jgi:hypothetical protein